MAIYKVPTQNSLQYTLDSSYTAGGSTLTLSSSLTGVVQAPGVCVVDRIDSSGNKTASKREYFTFTGVSGQQLTGCTGGLAGSTNQDHSVGAIVEFVPDIIQQQAIYDAITAEHSTSGVHTTINATTLINSPKVAASLTSTSMLFAPQAYLSTATIGALHIGTILNFSGASIVGFPSGASGAVLTAVTGGVVFAPTAGTGGFNALFQVPGNLAALTNTAGLIPIPTAFTAQYVNYFVQTPASGSSVSVVVKKNMLTTFAVGGIAAGATFGSSASIASAALVAGDVLTLDINSTATLATDLSVLVRAV